jgi:hypothetical protein
MASANKFQAFVENLAEKVHNLQADALMLAFCAAANAPVATNTVLANLTQISYTNFSSRAVTVSSSAQTSGTYRLICSDVVITISGGPGAGFRYTVLWNDTPTSPADPLILYWDYGADLVLADGEQFTIDFDGTNGVLTLA